MVVKGRNKVDKKSDHFLCAYAKCGEVVPLGVVAEGLVYHDRCAKKVKGESK